jgi:hypothetical protein
VKVACVGAGAVGELLQAKAPAIKATGKHIRSIVIVTLFSSMGARQTTITL